MAITLQGRQALHAWISDDCRKMRGDDGAKEEALRRVREQLDSVLKGWKQGLGMKIHIGVTVEPKASGVPY